MAALGIRAALQGEGLDMDLTSMMKQARKVQEQVQSLQDELARVIHGLHGVHAQVNQRAFHLFRI